MNPDGSVSMPSDPNAVPSTDAGVQGDRYGRAPRAPKPRIDDERRSKSPGISNNFFETSTADFKKPYGSA